MNWGKNYPNRTGVTNDSRGRINTLSHVFIGRADFRFSTRRKYKFVSEEHDGLGNQNLVNQLESFFSQSRPQRPDRSQAETEVLNVAQYQIERVLGSGGFGIVYLAHDTELNRPVALKIPRLDALFDQEKRMRFAAEAKMAARLNHPGIVQVYQANLEGAMPFIASEFCDGPNLSQWLKQTGSVPNWKRCVEMMAAVADAVGHAHQQGVFHRDIKPGNIIITLDKDSPSPPPEFSDWKLGQCRARLTDFGLAKLIGSAMTETRTSQVMGTPLYMAPEQIDQGEGVQPTAAVDIYSLGVVLFELLTGQMPITGSSYVNALDNIRSRTPRRLSAYRAKLPRAVETICAKCLEKNPTARYATASELAEDLRRCGRGEPLLGKRLGIFSRVAYWATRPQRVNTAGWFVIGWVSLITIWMAFNVLALPLYGSVTMAEFTQGVRDLFLLTSTAGVLSLWLAWKTIQGRSWALWGLLGLSLLRLPALIRAMFQEPVYFSMIYKDNPVFSFVDHSMMVIATGVQLLLVICGILGKRNQNKMVQTSEK